MESIDFDNIKICRRCSICGSVEYRGRLYASEAEIPDEDVLWSDTVLSEECLTSFYGETPEILKNIKCDYKSCSEEQK